MTLIEHQILSKILDDNSFYQLDKYKLSAVDFTAIPEVYSYIKEHVRVNGNVPDYRNVVGQFEQFQYQADVADNLPYLAKTLKSQTAKRDMYELLQHKIEGNFSSMTGTQFANWIAAETRKIADTANAASNSGINLAKNGTERKQLYLDSKEKGTGKYIKTPYPTLTEALQGGFELGDYILLLAYTNKGKSWIATDIATEAWQQGFAVLDYRPEISKYQMMNRFDTVQGQYNNVQLRLGKLPDTVEQQYFDYLDNFDDKQETDYILKTMDDMPDGLSLELLEADLEQNPQVELVIIDGFNLLKHRSNSRDGMTETSRKLRQIFGRHEVAGLVVHHTPTSAEKEGKIDSAEDSRLPKTPELTDYSETVAVVQDAYTVLTFNQMDGIGCLKLAKGKTPAVGTEVELVCDFNRGIIREPELIDVI